MEDIETLPHARSGLSASYYAYLVDGPGNRPTKIPGAFPLFQSDRLPVAGDL